MLKRPLRSSVNKKSNTKVSRAAHSECLLLVLPFFCNSMQFKLIKFSPFSKVSRSTITQQIMFAYFFSLLYTHWLNICSTGLRVNYLNRSRLATRDRRVGSVIEVLVYTGRGEPGGGLDRSIIANGLLSRPVLDKTLKCRQEEEDSSPLSANRMSRQHEILVPHRPKHKKRKEINN